MQWNMNTRVNNIQWYNANCLRRHWMTIPTFWPKPIPRLFFWDQIFRNRYFFSDTIFSSTESETFFPIPNSPKSNWDFFPRPSRSKPSKNCQHSRNRKVSKPKSFETEMSMSVRRQFSHDTDLTWGEVFSFVLAVVAWFLPHGHQDFLGSAGLCDVSVTLYSYSSPSAFIFLFKYLIL